MNRKITAVLSLLLAVILMMPAFSGCSKLYALTDEEDVAVVADEDDVQTVKGYTVIELTENGDVKTNADNVSVSGSELSGGTEVTIDGEGEYGQYYIISEVDSFLGQLVFNLAENEEIEVKFYNVNIVTQRKTAVKLVNTDEDVDKESDAETSSDSASIFSWTESDSTPKAELSFSGSNSFQANGSGKNGTIYSECRLTLKGHGSAAIDGGASLSGICSTESVTIKNVTLDITSAAKQGISCDKKVKVNAGATINIASKGDGIHCNKFEFNGNDSANETVDSVINISSLYTTECADGIDADNEVIINGGTLNITALTSGKYAIKVRKVNNGEDNGYFEINGGSVSASGAQITVPTSCSQSVVLATAATATTFTVGSTSSAEGAYAFLLSPSSADTVTAGDASAAVTWDGTVGQVSFE